MSGFAILEPLDDPAGLVRIIPFLQIGIEEVDGAGGEAVAGDEDERALRGVGFLLEVDDVITVEYSLGRKAVSGQVVLCQSASLALEYANANPRWAKNV